jgi:hypothetical protein
MAFSCLPTGALTPHEAAGFARINNLVIYKILLVFALYIYIIIYMKGNF